MFLVKSISLLSAVSMATLGSAAAGDLGAPAQDELFGGLLDLEETPMSADELGAARGGFSFGGMNFNISVDIAPLQIAPLFPNGVFGDSGGVLPNGVFGDGGNGNSSNSGANASDNSSNAAAPSVAAAPAAAPAPSNAPAAAAPAPSQPAPSAIAASPTPAPTASAPSAASPAPMPAPADLAPATVGDVGAPPVVDNSNVVVNVAPVAPSTDASAPPTAASAPPALAQSPSPQASAPAAPSVIASNLNPTGAATNSPSNNNAPPPSESPASSPSQAVVADSSPVETDDSGSSDATLSAVLTEMPQPEVIQQVGPNGITNIVNNALNNVHLTQNVQLNVEVQNYSFVTGLTRATNMTSQAVSQSIFLRGLN